MTDQVTLRPPKTSKLPSPPPPSPTLDHLHRIWHVTHSTLPLWKNKRNVTISLTPLEPTNGSKQEILPRLDDNVAYQTLSSDKIKTVHGIDTASSIGEGTAAWDWRGVGWLKFASSHWEILGFGQDGEVRWMLSFFAPTFVTPTGIDILSDQKGGVSEGTIAALRKALREMDDPVVKKLAEELFEVRRD